VDAAGPADAPRPRARRPLEIATRFPQRPPRLLHSWKRRRRRPQPLSPMATPTDTDHPTWVAAFQTFLSGRFSTFGDMHEVVSQAAKNLGYLTATAADLTSRKGKWKRVWKSTSVPRLQRGASVADFTQAFTKAVAAPQATRRVVVVTSSLSRSAVSTAFATLHVNHSDHEAAHVLWLLAGFVDQCRAMGAVPEIICRP
jgi:hypothetical protein